VRRCSATPATPGESVDDRRWHGPTRLRIRWAHDEASRRRPCGSMGRGHGVLLPRMRTMVALLRARRSCTAGRGPSDVTGADSPARQSSMSIVVERHLLAGLGLGFARAQQRHHPAADKERPRSDSGEDDQPRIRRPTDLLDPPRNQAAEEHDVEDHPEGDGPQRFTDAHIASVDSGTSPAAIGTPGGIYCAVAATRSTAGHRKLPPPVVTEAMKPVGWLPSSTSRSIWTIAQSLDARRYQ